MLSTEPKVTGKSITKIRKDFPILNTKMHGHPLVFLDNAASSQKPVQVLNAIRTYYENDHANVHRGVYELSARATEKMENARKRSREFINAQSNCEIIFTKGTTDSINLVAHGFRTILGKGDVILLSQMEHHSNIVPWQITAEITGAIVKVIPISQAGEIDLEAYENLLQDNVKIVALNHVSNTLGTINPVKYMVAKAHEFGIPVLLDGAQALPHIQVDVQDLDVDFYAGSSHKMYGPTGIGILYGKEKWLEMLPPYQAGGEMIKSVGFDKTTYNELPFKFEAGTPNIAGTIGLEAAMDYICGIGYDNIQMHEHSLLESATELLKEIPGLKIYGEARQKASLISFGFKDIHPYDIGAILDQQGVAVRTGHHCTEPLMDYFHIPGTVRASFAIYNSQEEVHYLVKAIRKAIDILK